MSNVHANPVQHTRATAGAVYVEFLIAIMPLLTCFWGLVQLNGLLLADLVTRHAAVNAVRAAIVCDSDEQPQDARPLAAPKGCSYEAAKMTLTAVKSFSPPGSANPDFSVSVQGASAHGNQPVTATVVAQYYCRVPLASFVCGLVGGQHSSAGQRISTTLRHQATLPNQGAGYSFSDSSSTQ